MSTDWHRIRRQDKQHRSWLGHVRDARAAAIFKSPAVDISPERLRERGRSKTKRLLTLREAQSRASRRPPAPITLPKLSILRDET